MPAKQEINKVIGKQGRTLKAFGKIVLSGKRYIALGIGQHHALYGVIPFAPDGGATLGMMKL